MVSIVQYLDVSNNIPSHLTIKANFSIWTLTLTLTWAGPRTSFRSLKIIHGQDLASILKMHNIGQYQTILVKARQYLAVFDDVGML